MFQISPIKLLHRVIAHTRRGGSSTCCAGLLCLLSGIAIQLRDEAFGVSVGKVDYRPAWPIWDPYHPRPWRNAEVPMNPRTRYDVPSSKQTRDHIDLWLDTSMKQGHPKKIIDSAHKHDVEILAR